MSRLICFHITVGIIITSTSVICSEC